MHLAYVSSAVLNLCAPKGGVQHRACSDAHSGAVNDHEHSLTHINAQQPAAYMAASHGNNHMTRGLAMQTAAVIGSFGTRESPASP